MESSVLLLSFTVSLVTSFLMYILHVLIFGITSEKGLLELQKAWAAMVLCQVLCTVLEFGRRLDMIVIPEMLPVYLHFLIALAVTWWFTSVLIKKKRNQADATIQD